MTEARKRWLPGLLFLGWLAGCGAEAPPPPEPPEAVAPPAVADTPPPATSRLVPLGAATDQVYWLEADSMAALVEAQIARYFVPREGAAGMIQPDFANAARIHGDPWELSGPPDYVTQTAAGERRLIEGPYDPHEAAAAPVNRSLKPHEQELVEASEAGGGLVHLRHGVEFLVAAPLPVREYCRACHESSDAGTLGTLLMRLEEIADD